MGYEVGYGALGGNGRQAETTKRSKHAKAGGSHGQTWIEHGPNPCLICVPSGAPLFSQVRGGGGFAPPRGFAPSGAEPYMLT
jgi:hypothetical protein